MSTISSFRSIENKHDIYRGGQTALKKPNLILGLREHAMRIINF